ncbi:hypothetical protein L2E82_18196 [Cichorium intybus]|uniref:Uncharacterized protein n=1 Tax=Cichorium intybus TaxID=13427 RepID=A0ACB9F938_CICIN|nr:hypothetical protein L2E82_18196 [Cichorium intybus]
MISQITTWDSMSWPAVDSDQNAKPGNMVQCQTYLIGLGVTISSPTRNESKLLYLAKNESMLLIIAFIWLSAARRCLGRFLIVDTDLSSGWEKRKMALVLFKEIGHSLNPANSLVLKVLSASPSAYSANPNSNISSPPSLSGSSISLVSVQARNNARIVFSDSLDLFNNKFFKSPVQKAGSSNKWSFLADSKEKAIKERRHNNVFKNGIVLLYGGVGPLPSDVSIAGVAKAFGVRLIKCENVIVLSATNVNEFDQQWESLIGSRLLATIGSFDEEMIEAAMEPISTKLSSK